MSRTHGHNHKKSFAPTSEDRYKDTVAAHQKMFEQIIGCKIIKITIPKDCCGNADDAYVIHVIDAHHNAKFIKVSSSEWVFMRVFDKEPKEEE